MPWNSSTGLLTKPISLGDISQAIGLTSGDLGTLITSGASNGLINKWAKYKPVRHQSVGSVTDSQRIDVLHGLSIPSLGIVNFPTRFSEQWGYNAPRGIKNTTLNPTSYNEWFRVFDFHNYQKNRWALGTTGGGRMLQTIFNGMLTIPGALVSDLDNISFNMQCRENDEIDAYLGLLYPYDFVGAVAGYQLSQYYVGLAIIDSQSNVWVISGPRVSDYFVGTNLYTGIRAAISNSISNGALTISPVLLENHTIPSGGTDPQWTSGYNGTIITFDGAYLPATKVAQTANLITNVTFTVGSSSITLNFTITNQSGSTITVNNMYCYLLSAAAEANEHDTGYSGPDYQGEGAKSYIERTWPGSYKQGDIYSHDWNGGYSNPDQLAARAYNAYSDFYAANNNSNIIGNNTTRTWSKTFNYTGDDFGSYTNGAVAMLCLAPTGNAFVREYFSY